MLNLFKAELYKLRHGKELKICIAIVFVIGLLNVFLHGDDEIGLLSFMSEIIGLIACALFAGLYLGNEFYKKTILYSVTSGNSRITVLLSKYLTYLIACIVILAFNALVMNGFYVAFNGWGQPVTGSAVSFILGYSIAGIFYDLCIISIPFLIVMLLKDTGISIVVSVVAIGSILACSEIFWVDRIFPISIMTENLKNFLPLNSILAILIIPVVAIGTSGALFRKADIK